jgi:hypothetical protein
MGETHVVAIVLPDRMTVRPAMGLDLVHHLETPTKAWDGPRRKIDCAGDSAHGSAHPVDGESTTVRELDCNFHVAP